MKCYMCEKDYSFICHCSEKYICKFHLGSHLSLGENHQYEKLTMTFDSIERSFFQKDLEHRISLLTHLKFSLANHTKDIIKYIKSQNSIQLKRINSEISDLLALFSKEEFLISDLHKMKTQLLTEISTKTLNPGKVLESIREFYSDDLFTSSVEPSKENSLKFMNFLDKHNGGFRCLAVSNDSKLIITGSEDTTVRVWDLQNRMQLACFAEHKSEILCVDFSEDCKMAVSGSFDKTLVLWDIEKFTVKQTFYGHSGAVLAVCFVVGQKSIVSVSNTKELLIWSLMTLKCVKKIETLSFITCGISIRAGGFLTGTNNSLEIWDLDTGVIQKSIIAHEKPIRSVSLSSDSKIIASCSDDKSVKIWEIPNATLYANFLGHTEAVLTVSITQDDQFLISGSLNQVIIIWGIESKEKIHEMTFHSSIIYGIKTVKDSIISISSDSRIGVTSLSSRTFEGFFSLRPFETRSVMLKENLFVFGSLNDVIVWDSTLKSKDLVLKGHDLQVKSTCITENMNFVISASRGTTRNLIVWHLKTQAIFADLAGHHESVFSVDSSKDEELIVSAGGDGRVLLWNLYAKRLEFALEGHSGPVNTVKFTKNKRFVISGGRDSKVIVWDLTKRTKSFAFSALSEKILITCDDKYAIALSVNKGANVLELNNSKQRFAFKNLDESRTFLEKYKNLKFEFCRYLF